MITLAGGYLLSLGGYLNIWPLFGSANQLPVSYTHLDVYKRQDIAKDYPQIEANSLIVDNTCMQLVMHPEQFDVMVMPNLYGDIAVSYTHLDVYKRQE